MSEAREHVDRSVFVIREGFVDTEDCAFWWSRTPGERLAYVQTLRELNYGDQASGRLQRVLEVAERTPR